MGMAVSIPHLSKSSNSQGRPFKTVLCATSLLDRARLGGGSSRALSLQGLILPPSAEIQLLP